MSGLNQRFTKPSFGKPNREFESHILRQNWKSDYPASQIIKTSLRQIWYHTHMYIKVKVTPQAKQDKVEMVKSDEFRVAVRAEARAGMANKKMLELLSAHIDIPLKKLRLVSGHTSPSKIVSVRDDL